MDRDEKRIDELLDAGLAGYSDVEPRAGLEGRILARLSGAAAEPKQKTWLRWWPAWGLALATAIALVVVISMPKQSKPIETVKETSKEVPQVAPKVTPQQVAKTATPNDIHERRAHVSFVRPPQSRELAAVKQSIFPAPSPLTDQERLLFSYMRRTPVSEIEANAKPDVLPAFLQQGNDPQINQVLPGQRTTETNTNTR